MRLCRWTCSSCNQSKASLRHFAGLEGLVDVPQDAIVLHAVLHRQRSTSRCWKVTARAAAAMTSRDPGSRLYDIAPFHCDLTMPKGDSRSNGVSEHEPTNQSDCEDDYIGHGLARTSEASPSPPAEKATTGEQ
jgi:hypothetical protein